MFKALAEIFKLMVWAAVFLVIVGLVMNHKDSKSGRPESGEKKIESTSEATDDDGRRRIVRISTNGGTIQEDESVQGKESTTGEMDLSEELSVAKEGQYRFVTNDDLVKYSVNMSDAQVYVVTNVDDVKSGMVQSELTDGFMMSSFHVIPKYYEKYEAGLKEGDLVAVAGTVSGLDDYGFLGSSVNLEDCVVFAVGSEAEKYKRVSSDEELSVYFETTEEVANHSDISKEEYVSICTVLDYEGVLRNPKENKGKYCMVSGTVDQVQESLFGLYYLYVKDANGNKWECMYSYDDGESHALEGDYVTVYGKCDGTATATNLLGKQVTMPEVDGEYLQIG